MSFAISQGLRPGDAVVVPKSELNLIAHYLIYLGINIYGEHVYAENIRVYGVREINENQFVRENPTYNRIRRMDGNDLGRTQAVKRAKSLIGKEYHLTKFNCEDYANYVQYNKAFSKQVDVAFGIAGLGLGLALLAALIPSESGRPR
jgi:hypothetical protein